jgi:hypothetical protein
MKERSLPRRPGRFSTWLGALGLAGVVSIVSMALAHPHYDSDEDVVVSRLVNPASEADLAALLDELEQSRVVMIGETHDRYDHHHNQLAVIRGLHERGVPIAVGVEYFQRPFQAHLDDFAAGRIDERALLERTEWRDRGFHAAITRAHRPTARWPPTGARRTTGTQAPTEELSAADSAEGRGA